MKKTITRLLLLLLLGATTISNSYAGCPITVLPNNGSTSGNARAPMGNFRYIRGVYIISAAEIAASGLPSGSTISQIAWTFAGAQSISVAGTLNVYLQNTSDASYLKGTSWATAVSTMTLASSASEVIPAGNFFNHTLSGAPAFTYTGGALYVAYEWSNPLNATSAGAVVSCATALVGGVNGLVSAQSNTALPTTLGSSAFRPDTRFATTAGTSNCACLPFSTNGGAAGDGITAFNFASLSHTATGGLFTPAYRSYAGTSIINAGQGATYPVSITNQYSGDADFIWIDFNDNGIFDDTGELVFQGGPGTSVTGTLTIPPTTPFGTYKLRLRNYDTGSNAYGTVTPCSSVVYGETKDFIINVVPPFTDCQVNNIYTLGKVAIEYGSPMTINAKVNNGGSTTLTSYNVTLNVSGSNSFTDVQTVTLLPGTSTIVSFAPYTPTSLSSGDVITVSVGSDDNNANNSQSWTQAVTQNLYSYKNPAQVNAGGVGFTGGTGDFVAKFNSHIGTNFPYNVYSPQINQIQVDFSTTNGQTYQLGIWDATGAGGTPGTNLWTSGNLTQASGTQFVSVPNISVSGDYYVGVRQIGVTNIGFAYQSEAPIRSGTFYYTSPTGGTTWTDFASTSSNFRFSIVAQVRIPQAPNCPGNLSPANLSTFCPLNPLTLSWASGGGATADNYDVYLSTNQTDVNSHAPAALVSAAQVGTTYTSVGLLTPGQTYYWTIVANSISEGLSSVGCTVNSFTVGTSFTDCYCIPEHPIGCGNGDITNVTFNAINNSSTCSAPGYTNYPAGIGTTTTVVNGNSYNLSVTTDQSCVISVWVDWNQNGVFETTEWSQVTLGSIANTPNAISLVVPMNALQGQTRMRIRSRFTGNPNGDVDACTSFGSGESEDYTINVLPCDGTPDAGNTVSDMAGICPSGTFNLSLSNAFPTFGLTYQWQSGPSNSGPWTNIGSTSNTYSGTHTETTWYQCIVTCANSSLSQTSIPVEVLMFNNPKPYLSFGDTALCSNVTGIIISVLDSGAFSGGYPNNTQFEWTNFTPPTLNLSSYFASSSGSYTAVVYLPANIGGCQAITSATNIDFGQAQAPLLVLSQNSVACFGESNGSITATVAYGNSPMFNYKWYNSSNNLVRDVTVNDTSDVLSNLPVGVYRVEVTNSVGTTQLNCSAIDSIGVTQPDPLSATTSSSSVSCNGGNDGSIDVTAIGGTAPYQYSTDGNNYQGSNILSGLTQGTYTVYVVDNNGCSYSTSAVVTEPTTLVIQCSNDGNVSCNGGQNGSASVSAGGGTAPYNYAWSNGSTDNNISGLTAGTYCVTVTDANGCNTSCCVTIEQPNVLTIGSVVSNVKCRGAANGTIALTPAGGTAPYAYLWNNGSSNANRSNLAPGTYCVTVTDANGCSATACYTISQPTVLLINVSKTNVRCGGKCTGYASANPTGGWGGYSYLWSNGATTVSISNLCAGTYTLIVTDAGGCIKSSTFTITQNPLLTVIALPTSATSAVANASGGIPPYSYFWNSSPLQYTVSATGLAPGGTYKVRVTDSKNCSQIATVTTPTPKEAASMFNLEVVAYPNPTDGIVTLQFNTVNGFAYQLSIFDATGRSIETRNAKVENGFNSSKFDLSYLPKGIYHVSVQSEKGNANIRIILQ